MTPTPEQPSANSAISRLGMAAVVIMAAGYGWVGGNFSTATDSLAVKVAITLGHLALPVALAVLAGALIANSRAPGARRAVTGIAWLSVLFVAVSTGYALANPNPNAFGPHSLADYTAIVILLAGALLWLLRRVPPVAATPAPHSGARESVAPRART